MTGQQPRCAPLVWGRGATVLDAFLEPTCPFSAIAFGKFPALLAAVGEDRLTLRVNLHSQPWHLFSGVFVRTILAASTLPDGRDAAARVMREVYARRDEFEPAAHSKGPALDRALRQVIARVEEITGLALAAAFEQDAVTTAMKRHARFSRQNGIHVSPTFMVDGLVNDRMGSRDELATWIAEIGLA